MTSAGRPSPPTRLIVACQVTLGVVVWLPLLASLAAAPVAIALGVIGAAVAVGGLAGVLVLAGKRATHAWSDRPPAWRPAPVEAGRRLGRALPQVVADADAGPATTHRLRDLDRRQLRWLAVLLALIVATGVRVVLDLRHGQALVVGDEALIARFAHEAPRDHPLIGKVTSAGLYGNLPTPHNPGPVESWTLAPFVLVLGSSLGAWVYAYVVNLGAALLAAWAGFRRGGPRLGLVVLTACLVMFELTAPGGVSSVLNTRIVLMPLFATMVLAAAVVLGDTALLALVVVSATFVVQTHIGYGLVPVAALGSCVVVLAWRKFRGVEQPRLRRHVVLAVICAAVFWAPPLFDQFFRTGNLSELLTARVPHGGPGRALDALGTMLNPEVILLHRGELSSDDYSRPSALTIALLVLLVGAVVVTQHRRLKAQKSLLVLAACCAAALALTAGLTPPSDTGSEHFYWLRATSAFLVLTVLLVVIPPSSPRRGDAPRRRAALALGFVLLALAPLWVSKQFSPHEAQTMAAVNGLVPDAIDRAPRSGSLIITHQGYWPAIAAKDGLVTELQDQGASVRQIENAVVDPDVTTWVITQGPLGDPDPVASYVPVVPERQREEDRDLPDTIVRWAREHGPLRLAGPGVVNLPAVLDGTSPTLCLDRYHADPNLLLDLDPQLVAELYFQQQIDSPRLPPALLSAVDRWALAFPTQVRLAPAPDPSGASQAEGLIFSRSRC